MQLMGRYGLGGDNGAAGGFDGFSGCGGDGEIYFQGFFQFAGGDDLEAPFGNSGSVKFEGRNGGLNVYSVVCFELVEGIQGDDDRLTAEGLEAALATDKGSAADQRKLATFEPDRNGASGLLAFLATTDRVSPFSGTPPTTQPFCLSFFDFWKGNHNN